MDRERGFDSLDVAFSAAMAPWLRSTVPPVVLFSGGVDSGTIAWELRRRSDVRLFTVGTRGCADFLAARESAPLIGLSWIHHEVGGADVPNLAERILPNVLGGTRTERSIQTAFGLAVAAAPPGTLLCGQGADELFLGYGHFRGLDPPAALARSETDLDRLLRRDWPLSQTIASAMERIVVAPYLDPEFVAAARSIPIDLRYNGGTPKEFFRRWAERRGVPRVITSRPKKALQFGSGIDRLLTGKDRRP